MQSGPESSYFYRFRDELKDKDSETHFRAAHLQKDIKRASIFIAFAILPAIIALSVVLYSLGFLENTDYRPVNILTNTIILLTVGTFLAVLKFTRSTRTFDLTILLYMLLVGAVLLCNQWTRPADYVGTVYLIYIVNNTVLMPVPVRVQLLPTAIFGVLMLGIVAFYREPTYPSESINVVITIITLILLGFSISVILGRYRRLSHLHFVKEQQTRAKLEDTLAKIKKLSGIVPICSHCLKIRDEEGKWQRTETYIRNHSEAEFSHGICPDCVVEIYPEL